MHTQTHTHTERDENCDMKYNKCRCDPIASGNIIRTKIWLWHKVCGWYTLKMKINEQYEQSVDSLNGTELWKIITKKCYFLILPADVILLLSSARFTPTSSCSFSMPCHAMSWDEWGSLLSFCCGFIDKTDMCNTKMFVVFFNFARPNLLCDGIVAVAAATTITSTNHHLLSHSLLILPQYWNLL